MDGRLGDLAGHEGIDTERDRLLEVTLGTAGTPGQPAHRTLQVADQLRRAR